ncbi:MAG: MBOAT family protein [Rhodocyclaceae bacterium]
MLFTSAEFILVFLPLALSVFFLLGQRSHPLAASWLFIASVGFYAWWMPQFSILLLLSIAWNYFIGKRILGRGKTFSARSWLVLGITVNLAVLAWFKYANFFVDNLSLALGTHIALDPITLPIGISFFTFTQIAFLADAYQKGVSEPRVAHYGLFVTYFPHLIAGPVLHHAQMMPQFGDASTYRFNAGNFAAGSAIFMLGLIKKVVIADGISPIADAVFHGSSQGITPDLLEAWLGVLAYTLQLYFDFSGYSDMAIGLSRMLNISLPYNFDSPYKALSIIDFWRRWHMTLSAFLRDYLYIPLGGSRHGAVRRYANLFTTMLLGGLWHGASWNFVIWGALHGGYLMINHAWRAGAAAMLPETILQGRAYSVFAWIVTLLAVMVGWVFFRATDLHGANTLLSAMLSQPVAFDAPHTLLWNAGIHTGTAVLFCIIGLLCCALLPNSNRIGEWLIRFCNGSARWPAFVLGCAWTIILCAMLINATRSAVSAFIYFNF